MNVAHLYSYFAPTTARITIKLTKKMGRTQQEIRKLRKDVRAVRKDIDHMKAMLERERRMDNLINEMKQAARQMLLMSHEL